MAEVLVQFTDLVPDDDGQAYVARACGGEMEDGRWQGWIEFLPADGGHAVRSGRETTQPNRQHTHYWATGLTPVYLEGALGRALKPLRHATGETLPRPIFSGPAEDFVDDEPLPAADSILNPFSVYRKGEALLRNQLNALSARHLANIAVAHGLSDVDLASLNRMEASTLVELIVGGVRRQRDPGRSSRL